MGLHIDPPAPWVTPEAFGPGSAIDQRTTHLVRAHGARCLTMWRESLQSFASGQPLTSGVIDKHARQSLDHWCMTRAAALVKADERHLLRKVEVRQKNRKEFRKTAAASGCATLADAKRRLLRSR
jgi:hypothetical protein